MKTSSDGNPVPKNLPDWMNLQPAFAPAIGGGFNEVIHPGWEFSFVPMRSGPRTRGLTNGLRPSLFLTYLADATTEASHIVSAWQDWVVSPRGHPARRQIIVQIINALLLTHTWESYEQSIENFHSLALPEASQEAIQQAVDIAAPHDWDIEAIRKTIFPDVA